ncbi:LIM domain only protein 7 isoform X4 [Tachysurus vachellii]|uniref:LIM domain only protein 7 isoform X4 n=1 Tax=Tachysurus vachellii TaxID=175792 RepID=UPI00296B18A3|nr:LIM domain only protein 7 isoform X4 [Tachysurus vachellii]
MINFSQSFGHQRKTCMCRKSDWALSVGPGTERSRASARRSLAHPQRTPNVIPTTQPLMLTQDTFGAQRFQLPDFWPRPDPTSGPRLIRCKRHPLLGREHPNDPYNVSEDILPDLENDDMFSRRTCAFYSNTELAKMKYGGILSLHHRSEPCIRLVTQHSDVKSKYPDIEKDDVATRRLQHQCKQRPLSGAPDIYHPVPIPDLWVQQQKLQAKISPPVQVASPMYPKQKGTEHQKSDDMVVRKLGIAHVQNPTEVSQRSLGTQTGPSVPSVCNEEDLQKWQAIREASRLRYKKKLMVERLLQKNSDSDGAKSLSDIQVEQALQQVQYEDLQKVRAKVKENEDRWQDDLTKWKNRRKSVNLDIMKKKEEREQIEILTSGSGTRKSRTFKEMEEERESREPGYRSRFASLSTSDDQDVFEEPTHKTRVLPSRSNTVDNPYSLRRSKVRSLPSLLDDEPKTGSMPTDEADAPSGPVQSSSGSSLLDDPVPISVISKPRLLEPTSNTQSTRTSTIISSPKLEAKSSSKPITESNISAKPTPAPRQGQSQASLYKPVSTEMKQPIAPQVSASLPRSYQRSDSARITSVVTPRPFGASATKVASLPRAYTVGDSQKYFNGETKSSRHTTINSQTSSVQSSNENEGQEEEQVVPPTQTSSAVTPVSRVAPQPKVFPVNSTQQESYNEMRISLNQKPNSSNDFGFQTNWDSTGAVVKSIKQDSPAELCHLQVGDKILAVNGQKVADMSYEQWKRSMDEALKDGSLFMDIRRQGKNSSPEPYANMSLDFTSRRGMDPNVKPLNVSSQPVNRLPSTGINGGINEEPVLLRNEEPISLKNLKRRSEFFEQGGSENQITDLPVPSHSASSTRWSWDPEEERRRQEKWQKEQDRQLQEKYQRDQEKLKEEFEKAQQEAVTEGTKQYQEDLRSLEMEREASRLKEEEEKRRREEERKRREEQVRLEEERKRREQQERLVEERKRREQQERVEEERKRREQEEQLEEERKRREEQKKREEQKRLEEKRQKEEEELKQREEEKKRREQEALRLQRKREEEEERRRQEAQQRLQANDVEYTFPELSYSHRAKSKSTPELDDIEKNDIKGVYSKHRGLAGWLLEEELRRKKDPHILRQQAASELELERRNLLSAMRYSNPERAVSSGLGESTLNKAYQNRKEPVSQAEVERQQIIQDMKKKTSLLPDNKWIRQSSVNNVNKQPAYIPLRRGESLDNLDVTKNHQSWRSSWTPETTSSIPDYSRPYSSLSSSRPLLPQSTSSASTKTENQPSSRNRSVSGRKTCTFCDMPLGKGAAMIIESLGLCFHLQCFKCCQCKADLGGSESGAEVRIRNKQLFCNSCYMRLKTGQPTAM